MGKNLWERAKEELDHLVELADNAMREANNDGGEYDRNEILTDARAVLSEMEKAECVEGTSLHGDAHGWDFWEKHRDECLTERLALLLLLEPARAPNAKCDHCGAAPRIPCVPDNPLCRYECDCETCRLSVEPEGDER